MTNKVKALISKLTKTGFGHLFGSSVINKILSFMNSVILVRLISKTEYGIYSNADNILSIFCLLEGLGMTSTFLQFGSTNSGDKKNNIWSFCYHFSVITQIILSIVIALTGLFGHFAIEGTGPLLVAMAFLPLVRLIRDMQLIYIRTEMMNKDYAYAHTFSTAITVVLSCVLSYFFYAYGLIAANYLSAIATIVFVMIKSGVKLPKMKWELPKKLKKKLLKFSMVCVVNNSTGSLMYLIDTFILGIVVALPAVTASYKVAAKIPTALAFVPMCVMTYIYPYFAKHKDDPKWCLRNYRKVILLFGGFNVLMVGFLILLAPQIVTIVFGAQYLDAVAPFRLLCLNYLIQSTFHTISGQLLVSQEKLFLNTFSGFASSILNTAMNLWLIPQYGSVGAAVATVSVTTVMSIVLTVGLYMIFRKKLKASQI